MHVNNLNLTLLLITYLLATFATLRLLTGLPSTLGFLNRLLDFPNTLFSGVLSPTTSKSIAIAIARMIAIDRMIHILFLYIYEKKRFFLKY